MMQKTSTQNSKIFIILVLTATALTYTGCRYRYNKNSFYNGCRECKLGYHRYMDFLATYRCERCVSGCKTCSNKDVCEVCFKGHFMKDNRMCGDCPNGCDVCPDEKSCQVCSDTFYLKGTQCEPCLANCKQCDNPKTCKVCKDGHYLDGGSQCPKCSAHCNLCSAADKCSDCEWGYTDDGKGYCREKTFWEKFLFWASIIGGILIFVGAIIWCCMKCRESNQNNYQNMGGDNEMRGYNNGYQ